MRFFYFLIISLLTLSGKSYAQCPSGNLTFITQTDIDNFAVSYPNCTVSSDGESDWVESTLSTNDYCIPMPFSVNGDTGIYINSFTTTGDLTNISNINSGSSANGYGNFSATHSVSQEAGKSIFFSAVPAVNYYESGLRIWVDWNKDGVFANDSSEIVYISPFIITVAHSSSFEIPADKAPGNYRMRVIIKWFSIAIDPCEIDNDFSFVGEAEDYTLTVLPASPCSHPTALNVSNLTMNSATINWTSTGNSFDIEWGVEGFTQGYGTQDIITDTSYVLSGLEIGTTYDFYVRQDCTASSAAESNWIKYTFSTNNYCVPVPSLYSLFFEMNLDSFTTTGGLTNISNTNSGFSANGYGNFSAIHSVSQQAGENISFSAVPANNYDENSLRIWVDWNKDGVFANDSSEIVYASPNAIIGTHNGSFNIPNDKQAGNYRMRVMIKNFYNYADPCEVNNNESFYGEAEDYNLTVIQVSCPIPIALTTSNLTMISTTINWTSTGNSFDVEWGAEGFMQGSGTQNTTTNTSYDLSGLDAGTSYDFYVRQNCTASSEGESNWLKYTFSTNNYCIPVSYWYSGDTGININSFTTTGGETNINNPNSGFSTNGYGNFSADHSVSQIAGESISFSAVPGSTQHYKGLRIWVDWNKDGVFNNDSSEMVYISPNVINITHNGSFSIPADKVAGNYRMRVMIKYNSTVIDPCEINNNYSFYGEAEDYTLKVLPVLPCSSPQALSISNLTMESATINWTSTGSLFDIEWGTEGFTQGFGIQNTTTSTSYDLSELDAGVSYDFYVRQDCNASSDGYSYWIKYTFSTNNYCIPVPEPTSGIYELNIDSFTTTGGLTNINNTNSGFSANGYGNFSATHSVSQTAGGDISFSAVSTYNYDENSLRIWVDWNKDGVFANDSSEIVYASPNAIIIGTHNSSFNIPNDKQAGNYRMRVIMKWFWTAIDPCEVHNNEIFYGEAEDYTLTVLPDLSGNCDSYTIWRGSEWSNGTPDTTKRVIINGNLTLTADITACELLLNSGVLTVNSDVSLTVNGEIVNTQSANNFIVQSGGNLIQVDEVENTGAISVKRSTLIKHLDYTIWSSPVIAQGLQAFSPLTLANRIRIYNGQPSINNWVVTTGNFVSGKGYMFRAPNANDGSYAGTYNWTGTFTGTPENGNVTAEFNTLGTFQSIGNPYPSNIERAIFHTVNPDLGTLYFWTNMNDAVNGSYAGINWTTINRLGDAVGPTGGNDFVSNGVISVGQGFLVETNGTTPQAVFNNTMRTSDSGVFFRTMQNERHRLWLDLTSGNQNHNQMLVGYMEEATNNEDFGIDSKLFGYTGSALYSLINNNENQFIIQGRNLPFNDMDVVPLGFRAVNDGSYTISLSNFDGLFAEGQDIFLKDKFTQTTQNLKDGSYTFVSETGTFNNRFEVVYRDGSLSITNPDLNNNWIVYKQNNTFHIQTQGFEMKEVVVYDVLGRVVYDAKNINTSIHTFPTVNGDQLLIVKIISTDNQTLSKKIKN